MSEDVETQKKGIVAVYIANTNADSTKDDDGSSNNKASRPPFDATYAWKAAMIARSQPIRCEAIHLTMDEPSRWGPLFDTIKVAISPFLRLRAKTHSGSFVECMYALQTFGIPAQEIPILPVHWTDDEGKESGTTLVVQTDQHVEMMTKRRERERREKAYWKARQASEAALAKHQWKEQLMRHPQRHDQLVDDYHDEGSIMALDDDAFMPIPIDETRVLLHQSGNNNLDSSSTNGSRTNTPTSSVAANMGKDLIDISFRSLSQSDSIIMNAGSLPPNNPHYSTVTPPMPPRSIKVTSSDRRATSGTKKRTEVVASVQSRSASLCKTDVPPPPPSSFMPPSPPPLSVPDGMEQRVKRTVPESHGQRVGVPSRNDVLFGRGKGFQNHIGNQKYRQMIEDCLETYEQANKEQKTRIAEEIIDFILLQAEGRFLKDMDGSGWRIVSDPVALRQKVAHAFRGLRDRKEKEQNLPVDGTVPEKPKRRSKTTKQQTTNPTRQVARQRGRQESDGSCSDGDDQDYYAQATHTSSIESAKRSKYDSFLG